MKEAPEQSVTTLLELLESVVTSPLKNGAWSKYDLAAIFSKYREPGEEPMHENKAHQKVQHFRRTLGMLWIEDRARVLAMAEMSAREIREEAEQTRFDSELNKRIAMNTGRADRASLTRLRSESK